MKYHFKNLVFEGGGVKGIAYLGALEVLQQRNISQQIQRIGGTSTGAVNAILMGLGYSLQETTSIIWSMDLNKFKDDSWGVLNDAVRLLDRYGWYKGDYFRDWIAQLIAEKTGNPDITFAELEDKKRNNPQYKSLFLIGTNLSTRYAQVFSAEHTPHTSLADAMRISMSIPLFFASVKGEQGDIFVDGSVLNNYPIKLFDRERYVAADYRRETDYYAAENRKLSMQNLAASKFTYNKQTLGFRLDSSEQISVFRDQNEPTRHAIGNFLEYTEALIMTLMEAQQNAHLHSDDWARTVYIDTLGVKTTDFALTDERKQALVDSGVRNTEKYFDWFDSAGDAYNK